MSLMRMMIFMICELGEGGGRYLGKGVHSIKGLGTMVMVYLAPFIFNEET